MSLVHVHQHYLLNGEVRIDQKSASSAETPSIQPEGDDQHFRDFCVALSLLTQH